MATKREKRPRIKTVGITIVASSNDEKKRLIGREGMTYFVRASSNG